MFHKKLLYPFKKAGQGLGKLGLDPLSTAVSIAAPILGGLLGGKAKPPPATAPTVRGLWQGQREQRSVDTRGFLDRIASNRAASGTTGSGGVEDKQRISESLNRGDVSMAREETSAISNAQAQDKYNYWQYKQAERQRKIQGIAGIGAAIIGDRSMKLFLDAMGKKEAPEAPIVDNKDDEDTTNADEGTPVEENEDELYYKNFLKGFGTGNFFAKKSMSRRMESMRTPSAWTAARALGNN